MSKNLARFPKPLKILLKVTPEREGKLLADWGGDHYRAFERLKTTLVHALALAKPYSVQPFIVDADASGDTVGAVLS